MLGVTEVDEGVQAGHRLEDDVAALAAIAAVRTAIFDELLAPERDRARAAGTGADENLGLIEKVHLIVFSLAMPMKFGNSSALRLRSANGSRIMSGMATYP